MAQQRAMQGDSGAARQRRVPGLSVVVPAYNEASGITHVIAQLESVLANAECPHEIIVVDDGSEDNTADLVGEVSRVRILRHDHNLGYGAALKTGIRHAQHDLVCITDADGTYPSESIPELVERLVETGADMVVAARTGKRVAIPAARRPAKWILGKLANLVAGESIPDLNSGLRVFNRQAVRRFFGIPPDGFSFTTTITLSMLANGYAIEYVSIDYRPRIGRSKIRPIRDTLNLTQLVLRIALYFAPLKIFLPISGLLLVLAIVWGLFSAFILGRLADVSTLVIFMTAVQVGVIGLLAELITQRLGNAGRTKE